MALCSERSLTDILPPELIARICAHLLPSDRLSLSKALGLPSMAPMYEEISIPRGAMFNRQCWDTLYPSNNTCILDFQSDQEIEQVELHISTEVHPERYNRTCYIAVKKNIQYMGDLMTYDYLFMQETRASLNLSITTSMNTLLIEKGDRVTVEFYDPVIETPGDDQTQILSGPISVSVRTFFKTNHHRSRQFSNLMRRINKLNILPEGLKRLARKR